MPIDKYLSSEIEDLLIRFPKIKALLNEYNIYCGDCSRATCSLRDALEIHNLNKDDESLLLDRISEIIFPDKILPIPHIDDKVRGRKYIVCSVPINQLILEHNLIKNWLVLVPSVIEIIKNNGTGITPILEYCRGFISEFIQDYHQLKEEDHLFTALDENLDILNNMYDEHEEIRFYARILLAAIGDNDNTAIKESLNTYRVVLSEHVKKEEEILYPWIERNLSENQLDELSSKFLEFDTNHPSINQNHRDIINELDCKINELLQKSR